ncbi:MAG: NAD(P)/FAD-dependent oxidoreductase [Luteitalea sp.]
MQKAAVIVVGAGAGGLMAAIHAARVAGGRRVVALDGATRLGAKIRIAGGGRCNVTHHEVAADDFSGSTTPAIRRVLRAFDVQDTIAFFASGGVDLKRETTGKLFPVTDRADDVLRVLVESATTSGAELVYPARVTAIARDADGFLVQTTIGPWRADAVVVATGGRSVPRTGSDGAGHGVVQALGVPLTPRIFPALVPVRLPDGHALRALSGLAADVELLVTSSTGRHLHRVAGALLCTHDGLSGPAVLDVSRHWQTAVATDPGARLLVQWMPGTSDADLDRRLQQHGARPIRRALSPPLPERLADIVCLLGGVDPVQSGATLSREARRALVGAATAWPVPITGTRGFAVAEVTAGGVPLSALTADLEARACPRLFLCGEICDVDGRIGGFNFQWAWAGGWVAGGAAARSLNLAVEPVAGWDRA